jgi:hypothetical protein
MSTKKRPMSTQEFIDAYGNYFDVIIEVKSLPPGYKPLPVSEKKPSLEK